MNQSAGQNDRQSERESVERSENSLELEAEEVRVHLRALSSSRPPTLCADQGAEVQAEVQFLPSPHTLILHEQPLVVQAGLTIE